jgi:hypothetical protein
MASFPEKNAVGGAVTHAHRIRHNDYPAWVEQRSLKAAPVERSPRKRDYCAKQYQAVFPRPMGRKGPLLREPPAGFAFPEELAHRLALRGIEMPASEVKLRLENQPDWKRRIALVGSEALFEALVQLSEGALPTVLPLAAVASHRILQGSTRPLAYETDSALDYLTNPHVRSGLEVPWLPALRAIVTLRAPATTPPAVRSSIVCVLDDRLRQCLEAQRERAQDRDGYVTALKHALMSEIGVPQTEEMAQSLHRALPFVDIEVLQNHVEDEVAMGRWAHATWPSKRAEAVEETLDWLERQGFRGRPACDSIVVKLLCPDLEADQAARTEAGEIVRSKMRVSEWTLRGVLSNKDAAAAELRDAWMIKSRPRRAMAIVRELWFNPEARLNQDERARAEREMVALMLRNRDTDPSELDVEVLQEELNQLVAAASSHLRLRARIGEIVPRPPPRKRMKQ